MLKRLIRRILFVLFPRKFAYDIACDVVESYVTDDDLLEGLYSHVRHAYIYGFQDE